MDFNEIQPYSVARKFATLVNREGSTFKVRALEERVVDVTGAVDECEGRCEAAAHILKVNLVVITESPSQIIFRLDRQ